MSHHGYDNQGRPVLKLPEYLLELCRQLRQDETPPEEALWRCLRDRRLFGLEFRRQHALGRYIADFYCHEARLVVELDGAVHEQQRQAEYDVIRQKELEASGARVVRFRNDEVTLRLPAVLKGIAAACHPSPRVSGTFLPVKEGDMPPSPRPSATPLPEGEGGEGRGEAGSEEAGGGSHWGG